MYNQAHNMSICGQAMMLARKAGISITDSCDHKTGCIRTYLADTGDWAYEVVHEQSDCPVWKRVPALELSNGWNPPFRVIAVETRACMV